MFLHHWAKSKHFMLSGKPALVKQSATWSLHCDLPLLQPFWSFQSGRLSEHHLPQPYSHLGGVTTVVVQTGLLDVVGLVLVGGVVVGGYVVGGVVVLVGG